MTVHIFNNFAPLKIDISEFTRLVRIICSRFKIAKADITIMITGNKEIRRFNARFLGHNHSTDCLSFDLSPSKSKTSKSFDIIVNAQKATRQAKRRKHSIEAEIALYITHGLLHNLGFDDSNEKKAQRMHAEEDSILQKAGYGVIYNTQSCDE